MGGLECLAALCPERPSQQRQKTDKRCAQGQHGSCECPAVALPEARAKQYGSRGEQDIEAVSNGGSFQGPDTCGNRKNLYEPTQHRTAQYAQHPQMRYDECVRSPARKECVRTRPEGHQADQGHKKGNIQKEWQRHGQWRGVLQGERALHRSLYQSIHVNKWQLKTLAG